MAQETEYFLKFPYGTQGGVDLVHEFKLDALSSHYDYTGKLYREQMDKGHKRIFTEIKSFSQVSFFKHFHPVDYLSVFSSAIADKRTIPYAFIFAKDGKNTINTLVFKDFRVTQFRFLSLPDEDKTPFGVWIMLMAKEVV